MLTVRPPSAVHIGFFFFPPFFPFSSEVEALRQGILHLTRSLPFFPTPLLWVSQPRLSTTLLPEPFSCGEFSPLSSPPLSTVLTGCENRDGRGTLAPRPCGIFFFFWYLAGEETKREIDELGLSLSFPLSLLLYQRDHSCWS